jgi:hypothetical protein
VLCALPSMSSKHQLDCVCAANKLTCDTACQEPADMRAKRRRKVSDEISSSICILMREASAVDDQRHGWERYLSCTLDIYCMQKAWGMQGIQPACARACTATRVRSTPCHKRQSIKLCSSYTRATLKLVECGPHAHLLDHLATPRALKPSAPDLSEKHR